MKRFDMFDKMLLTLCALSIMVFVGSGWDDGNWIEKGRFPFTTSTNISTHTATEFVPASKNVPDGFCKNFSGYMVYIGSNTTTLAAIGLPLAASGQFKIGGSITGAIHALAEPSAGTGTDMRCFFGKMN